MVTLPYIRGVTEQIQRALAMEDQLRELQEALDKLRAENESLRRASAEPSGSSAGPPSGTPEPAAPARGNSGADRLVFVPRDRRCPMFRGSTGISLGEWLDEAQACMRARHLSAADQAFFLFDHLEGEAREEIKYRSAEERSDPKQITAILQDLYGCTESYVALQEAFFSHRQQDGEMLLEFSLALMSLMEKVKQRAPNDIPNADDLLRDQFVEQVLDGALRRELKHYVRGKPGAKLLEVRGEAMRWEREGLPAGVRGRSNSVPSALGIQYAVHGDYRRTVNPPPAAEVSEMKEMLRRQQEQLDQLMQSVAQLQAPRPPYPRSHLNRNGPIICRRCQQPGHIARDCDWQRAPPRSQLPMQGSQQSQRRPEN
ncbi:hypothetical protein WMY93_008886 [Mugilogobius chulae]|uniref:CCHC-type domain-containing protein n=1 Tax=Mugilogobius chulae TaxID=88201 RepID=A0AAW0PGD6_9GOBI